MASDKKVIRNYKVREAITTGLHYHLDSFSSVQWYWGPDKENQPKTADGFRDFNHTNVCKSLIILLNEFFPGENCEKTINWEVVEDHSHKVTFRKNNTGEIKIKNRNKTPEKKSSPSKTNESEVENPKTHKCW